MKIARITYLFALCPALLIGMTSCSKGSSDTLPGKALSYEEALEQVKKTAPEYNMRTSLSKGVDITLGIDYLTIDGKVTLPQGEPTNVRFTLPKQDDLKLSLKNENGVKGALEVRERLSHDIPSTANAGGGGEFGGNFLINCLFNPFLTTYTLNYLHTMVSEVADLNIVNEKFSLDGETMYISYSIPDLKVFTELADQYELGHMTELFTVFRGTDGNVTATLGFDKYGYLATLGLKADSNDIAFIGDSYTQEENFRGYAHVNINAKIKQNFYAESDYHAFSAIDYSSNADLNIRSVTSSEYQNLGFKTRELDVDFVQDVLDNYSDVMLPGYGADFIIEHKDKTSNSNNMLVDIDGIYYPITDFIEPAKEGEFIYNWSANGATMPDGETRNGRLIIEGEIPPRDYYAMENYTLLPNTQNLIGAIRHDAALFEEMLKIKTSGEHTHSAVKYSMRDDARVKDYIHFYECSSSYDPLDLFPGKTLNFVGVPFERNNFSTELNALPHSYAHFNFRMSDGGYEEGGDMPYGISYGDPNYLYTTKTDFAVIDGASHGILDIYGNLNKDGGYDSPVIRPAQGFKFNPSYANKSDEEIAGALINSKFIVKDSDTAPDLIAKGNFTVKTERDAKTKEVTSFTFNLNKDYIDEAKEYTYNELGLSDVNYAAAFRLMDFENDGNKYDPNNSIFVRDDKNKLEVNDNCFFDFAIVDNSDVVKCYNPKNGLENGSSKATVEKYQPSKGDPFNILNFEDFSIHADDGYIFDKALFANKEAVKNFMDGFVFDSDESQYTINSNKELVNFLLENFASLSSDMKEITFSPKNIADEQKRVDVLRQLFELVNEKLKEDKSPTVYLKILFYGNGLVMEEKPFTLGAVQGESSAYMHVVPGPDWTYVQILPNYTNLIDKDLKFVFDF